MGPVLAIDQGTTSTRALVVGQDGAGRLTCSIEHKQYYPQAGWVEHDPEELIDNILKAIASAGEVVAMGIDNQGESCLAWNGETGEPISPVIVWQDARTAALVERLKAEGAEPKVLERSGLPLDAYFSAAKLGWLYATLPEAKTLHKEGKLRLGTTDAFFLNRLTGRCVTDVSTASRTSLMNIATCQWDEELCRLFKVPMDALPEIVPTTGDFGMAIVDGAKVPVTACVVDQQAALYAMQSILEGIAFRAAEIVLEVGKQVVLGESISIDGGLSQNPYLCQFLADVLQKSVVVQQSGELTAYVAASLASGSRDLLQKVARPQVEYLPQNNMNEYLFRFHDAAKRSLQWHVA